LPEFGDARGFKDRDPLDLGGTDGLRDSMLIGVKLDRAGIGGNASGQANNLLDPSGERLKRLFRYADHDDAMPNFAYWPK
jgi:hypothetical protein